MEVCDNLHPALDRERDMTMILAHWETVRNGYAQPKVTRPLGFTVCTKLPKSISGPKHGHKSEGYHVTARQLQGSGDLEDESVSPPQHHFTLRHLQTLSVVLSTSFLTTKKRIFDLQGLGRGVELEVGCDWAFLGGRCS